MAGIPCREKNSGYQISYERSYSRDQDTALDVIKENLTVTRSLKKVLQLSAVSLLVGLTTLALAGSENGKVNVGGRDRFIGAWRLVWLEEEGADGNVHKAD